MFDRDKDLLISDVPGRNDKTCLEIRKAIPANMAVDKTSADTLNKKNL